MYVWALFWRQQPFHGDNGHLVRDFLHFYTQGLIARHHDLRALYDLDAMAQVADGVLPGIPKHAFPPVYGPQVALFFAPLSRLSYLTAMRLWLAMTTVGTCACLVVTWRHTALPRPSRWVMAVLALGAPGLHFTLSFGQASLIGVFALTLLWVALQGQRGFLAGIAVGLLAYKPQLGIVAAAVFIVRGEWRVVAGAATCVVAQAVAAVGYWGPSIFAGYVGALRRLPDVFGAMEPDARLAYSIRAICTGLGLSSAASLSAAILVSLVVVAGVVWTWRPSMPTPLKYASLVLASLLVNPHLYGYDLLLASPAMIVLAGWAWTRRDHWQMGALGVLYAAPILAGILPGPPLVTTLALGANLAFALARWHGNNLVGRHNQVR